MPTPTAPQFRRPVTAKLVMVAALTFLLLVPTVLVGVLVQERQNRRATAIAEASAKWGSAQTITGPVLTVPYKRFLTDDKGRPTEEFIKEYAHVLPEKLSVEGQIASMRQKRGIYDVAVYRAQVTLDGSFPPPQFRELEIAEPQILWDEAAVTLGVNDLRGVTGPIQLSWDGSRSTFHPGLPTKEVIETGVSTRVRLQRERSPDAAYPFSLQVSLNGSGGLSVVPVGKETAVTLAGDWGTPSFDGAFLPRERSVTAASFQAAWNVVDLNRNFPQFWKGRGESLADAAFGVALLIPVDQYQQTTRMIKYAILFIALTFLVFFFVEIFNPIRIHPFQYLLVGLALALFYTLLLSISEHFGFAWAYTLSSVATVALVAAYARSVLKSRVFSLLLGVFLAVLYGFMYLLLQLQDYALLVGSIGLFVVLATVMYASRRVDWYALETRE